jgi:peptidoglycan/LPS O-acetylase OafA/YrhL
MIKIFHYNAERLHGLDHLRAMAILLVMVFHYGKGVPSWLEPMKQIGWTGVDLFFVLSGYLIGYQILKEINSTNTISFKSFYIKRFFRIIPAYVAVLVLYYALPNVREGAGLPPLWKFLTFTQNFGLDAQTQNSFSHAWLLCIEEQFYLLLPIILFAFSFFTFQKGGIYLIATLLILGFACRLYNWNEYVQPFIEAGNRRAMVFGFIEKIYYPSYNRMDGLTLGVGIAALLIYRPKIKDFCAAHGNSILLTGIGLLIFASIVCTDFISYKTAIYGFPLFSIAYGVIVIAAISPTSVLYKFNSRITFVVATLSYAIYLTHKQVYHLVKIGVEKVTHEDLGVWTFWICIFVAFIGGFILHLIVEKPFLGLRKKVLDRLGLENKRL